jgi:hypothetical protein
MKKLLLPMLMLSAMATTAQNVVVPIPNSNEDGNPPIALNNDQQVNQNPINQMDIQINNPPSLQVQIQQAPVQQTSQQNRGNVFGNYNSNPVNNVKPIRYGQSIQPVAGGGGYSGSSGKANVKKHSGKSFEFVLQKTFKKKYKQPRHYANARRVKICHSF